MAWAPIACVTGGAREVDDFTPDDVQDALAPIASLISKSEKAQLKLTPGTWQDTMLRDNLFALRIAMALLDGRGGGADQSTHDELRRALEALDSMIGRVENTRAKFEVGTSQHTLQRNRLKALRIARAAVEQESARP